MWALAIRGIGSVAARVGLGRAAGTAAVEAGEQVAARGAGTAVKEFFSKGWGKISGLWSNAPQAVRTTAKVGGGVVAAKEGVEYAAGQLPGADLLKKAGKHLPLLLGAAALGGLFLAFKDKIFGKDEAPDVSAAPQQPSMAQALSAEEQLLAPQMQAPIALGSTVTASYPAAVGSVAPQVAQAAPPPANNWQERVGGPKQPAVMTTTPQESYLAAEQARAEAAAAMQHNGVA